MTPHFIWLSRDRIPPGRWDLRLLGWSMMHAQLDDAARFTEGLSQLPRLFDCRAATRICDWRNLEQAQLIAAIGIDDPEERAEMMAAGIGEAIGTQTAVVELRARLTRMVASLDALPRRLKAGPVTLDLFHRDASFGGRWMGLHPREFELLWRLTETPDERVSREQLLSDVWRLDHVPETNSMEVHVSRLRAKLAVSSLAWLVETDPLGGYRLGRREEDACFAFSETGQQSLDSCETIDTDAAAETPE